MTSPTSLILINDLSHSERATSSFIGDWFICVLSRSTALCIPKEPAVGSCQYPYTDDVPHRFGLSAIILLILELLHRDRSRPNPFP